MAKDKNDSHRDHRLLGIWAPIGGLIVAGLGLLLLDEGGAALDKTVLQISKDFLVLLGVGGVLTGLPYWQEHFVPLLCRPSWKASLLKWLALLGSTLLLSFWFHDIAFSHDHAVHCFKAFHFWHEMLGRGRLKGWSPFLTFGYPSGELTPFGPELWVAMFRAVTLGLLSWTRTYALAFAGVVVFSVVAVFLFSKRFFGRTAATLAAIVWVLDPGTWYQGGWFWFVWLGVWPVTLAVSFVLLALINLADLLSSNPALSCRWPLLKAAFWMLASLVTHQLPIVVYCITLPCLLAAEWLRNAKLTREQVLRFAAAVGLGVGLAAFNLVPMFARNGFVHDYGLRGSSLTDLAHRLLELRLFENGWPPLLVLGLLGGIRAIRSRTPSGLFFVLCASAFVVLSSDIVVSVFHVERLMESILKVECPRMLLLAKLFCFPLAAHAVVAFFPGRAGERKPVGGPLRRLGVVVLLAALGAPLVRPAWLELYRTQVKKTVEHRGDSSLAHDLQQFYQWSSRERHASDEPYRIAYSLLEKHDHIVSISPVFNATFLHLVGSTPAQHFRSFPMSDEPELLEALAVKYLVADHDYGNPDLILEQRIGELRVYRFTRYRARQPFTIIGTGQAELVKLEPERVHLRLWGTSPGTRLKLHYAGFPRWQAMLNGREVPIDPATVYGMEYPILMEVPVGDGELIFRYVRRAADWLGLLVTLVSLFVFGLVAMGRPEMLARLDWRRAIQASTAKTARMLAWWTAGAALVCAGIFILLRVVSPAVRSTDHVLDNLAPTDELSLAGARCEAQGPRRWRCGEHVLSKDVVGGAYGSHLCMTTPASGPLVISTRQQLGRFLVASYDAGGNAKGRISLYVDGELLGDAPARDEAAGLTLLQADTRARAGSFATLRCELEGPPLHCFDLRILR